MTDAKMNRARKLFEEFGPVIKTNILRENKLFSRDIAELISLDLIRKLKTGYYVWGKHENDVSDIALAASLIPNGIICLQSAAQYHELTTLNPTAVSVAIPSNSMRPILPEYPLIDIFMMPYRQFDLGLLSDESIQSGLRIYDRERTVCDLFRKRNSIGKDIALEVLRNYMNGPRRIQLLLEYAEALRIKSVITPYIEALL